MGRKILIAALSLMLAFAVGCIFGFGYYYVSSGFPGVSATPLEPSSPPLPEEGQEVSRDSLPAGEDASQELPAGERGLPAGTGEPDQTGTIFAPDVIEEPGAGPGGGADPAGGAAGAKIAYITIDDGPDPVHTPAILEILDHYNVKASFFVLGTNAQKYPELIKLVHEKGHTIGNHTYNHIYKETYASDDSFWDSVKKTEDILYELLEYRPTLIREPGGRFRTNPEKQQMIRDQGYDLVYWNIDSYDSRSPIPDKDTIFANVKRQAQKEHLWPAMVILFHESGGHRSTVEALPLVIEYLLQEGFTLKPLAEMDKTVMADLPRP
ncbi:MAG TPA: polysaccharide deacetylase [Clostridia bacterium]|nr:polysaccharide deacetylase [Clostridia bacterium]